MLLPGTDQLRILVILSAMYIVSGAFGAANAGSTNNVKVPCPPPCAGNCSFEIKTTYTYDAANKLTKVRLSHRTKGTDPVRCESDIDPNTSSIKWTTGGVTTELKYDPNGANNVVGDRNNVNDFIKDMQNAGWAFVANDGVNSMELCPAGIITALSFSFSSTLICTCDNRDKDGNTSYATVVTEMTGEYDESNDPDGKGVKDDFDKGEVENGKHFSPPDSYGSGIPSPVLGNGDIGLSQRLDPGQSLLVNFLFTPGQTPVGLTPSLEIIAWNIRDATGNSDVSLSVNGTPIDLAFDQYNLDIDATMGVSQLFNFPLTGPHHAAVVAGNVQVQIDHSATDGQFIGIDFVGLNLDNGLRINEIRIDQPGVDVDEYFELRGAPGQSLNGLTYLVIGDGTGLGSGVVESVVDLTGLSIPADGFFLAVENTHTLTPLTNADLVMAGNGLNFENSDNVTHLLVAGFTGLNGDDLDTNDDGVLDVLPWSNIVDRVALVEELNPPVFTEFHYGTPAVGPDVGFVPGHVLRCESDRTWIIGQFDPLSSNDTPGEPGPVCVTTNPCPADCAVPNDGTINVTDLLQVLADWGGPSPCDLDGNGVTDVSDLLGILGAWGICP